MSEWEDNVLSLRSQGRRGVVWGAGSKGIMFVNTLRAIEYLVDINPRKEGRYVPCSGYRVLSPQFLRQLKPDFVIVMNREYKSEIQEQMKDVCADIPVYSSSSWRS